MLLIAFIACDPTTASSAGTEVLPAPTPTTAEVDCTLPAVLGVPLGPTPRMEQPAIALDGTGTGTLDIPPGFDVTDRAGMPVTELELPMILHVRATGGRTGDLQITRPDCLDATIELRSHIDPGLSAIALPSAPGHSWADAWPTGGIQRVAVDPTRWPQIQGPYDVYAVPDRDWDFGAVPDAAVPVPGTPDTILLELGPATAAEGLPNALDLWIDLDRDGTFSPGDLLDGADGPGAVVFPDLSAPGPALTDVRNVSASMFRTQRVFWPNTIAQSDTPLPLVVISHGRGHEYDWYDDLQQHLASWGYVVMSHRSDTGPGPASAAATLLDNVDFFLGNLSAVDPALEGRVDASRIAWIGHSIGGEAVLVATHALFTGAASPATFDYDSLRLISSIAPTVNNAITEATPHDRPFHLLIGGADGDVTQGPITPALPFPCSLCKSFRLMQDNQGPQSAHYLQGAAHNDFNCCGFDDGQFVDGPKVGRDAAQRSTRAIYTALLGQYLRDDTAMADLLRRWPGSTALPGTGQPITHIDIPARRADTVFIEDFQSEPDPSLSSSGTTVVPPAVGYFETVFENLDLSYAHDADQPANGMSQSHSDGTRGERGALFSFDSDVSWQIDLPHGVPAREHRAVSIRVAQGTRHPRTVALGDSLGFELSLLQDDQVFTIDSAAYTPVAPPYSRGGTGPGRGWTNEFATIRIPLADFESLGVDRTLVTAVRLSFGPSHGSPEGRVALDDLAFHP